MHLDTPSEATAAANQSLRARRRTSAPLSVNPERTKKRSGNTTHMHNGPASPEIISSLIDQLSAISVSANDHFENLLVGYHNGPATPTGISRTSSARNSIGTHDGAAGDASGFYNPIRQHNDAYPDDACEPPVIRTAKPPSGLSSLTAPKKKDKAHSLSSYIGRNSASSVSIHSTHSNHSSTSFGAISIEAGAPGKQPVASERSSAESKRSAKGHRSLMYMSSRERLRLKESDRKRQGSNGLEDNTASFSYEDTIKEEPASRDENAPFAAEPSRLAQRFSDRNNSPRRLRLNLVDEPPTEVPSDKAIIPERGSSLKHTGSPTRKSKKSRSSKSDVHEQSKTLAVPKKVQKMNSNEKMLQELEQEENEVAQRIRELRERKIQREKSAGTQPVHEDAGVPPANIPRVSVIPSPEPSPTSTVSSASGKRVQDPSKAHKVLGISRQSSLSVIPAEPLAGNSNNSAATPDAAASLQTRLLRHSRHKSLTLNDGEDFTPLPINYTLALQKAEEESPPTPGLPPPHAKYHTPPAVSLAPSRETRSDAASHRSSSVGISGHSALARSATSSTSVHTTKGHKSSSSVTSDSALSGMASTVRTASLNSASEEHAYRHKSMIVSSQASNSFQLQRRRTLTRKRWSHPDLPARAEKAHNEKVDKAEAKTAAIAAGAVQKPPHPVIEERPTSADSVDNEVTNYLNSQRLSQKIRHPQTGRIISFSEVGDRNGFAVFVCVGMGLTRYVMSFYDQLAATLKLRLITPDRPGIGGSQVDPNGTPLSWPGQYIYKEYASARLTPCRRCSCDLSSSQNYQVLLTGTFRRCSLRACNFVTDATAYSWPCTSSSALDTSVSDGSNRHQSRLTTNTAITQITAFSTGSTTISTQSCQFNLPWCNKCKSATIRSKERNQNSTKEHTPPASRFP